VPDPTENDWTSTGDAARYIGVTLRTLYSFIDKGTPARSSMNVWISGRDGGRRGH
jgi:hypothetical protein